MSDSRGEFAKYVECRVNEMAAEEMEKARERLKQRIPELAAEIGVRLQSEMEERGMEAVLQIVIRPKL